MQNALIKTTTQSLQKLSKALAITDKLVALDLFEDTFYRKLLEKDRIDLAIELALNARLELDWYYDLLDLDIFEIFKNENSKNIWKNNLVEKIIGRLKKKDLSFQPNMKYVFPKNEESVRENVYTVFEDYVIRYLLGIVILDYQDVLLNEKSINYNKEIFSTEKILEDDKAPARFVQWQEDNFFNGEYRFLAHFDIKKFFLNVEHSFFLDIVSNTLNIEKDSFFFELLKSALLIREINEERIVEKERGLVIQAVDRFFADIFLKSIDDSFSSDKILYQRKMDDIIILFNDYSDYQIIEAQLKRGLLKLGLELNSDKTKLIDKQSHNFKEALYRYIGVSDSGYAYRFDHLAVLSFDIDCEEKRHYWDLSEIIGERYGHITNTNEWKLSEYIRKGYITNTDEFNNISKNKMPVKYLKEDIILQGLNEAYQDVDMMLRDILCSRISIELKIRIIKRYKYGFPFHHDDIQYQYLNYVIVKDILQEYALDKSPEGDSIKKNIAKNSEIKDSEYNLHKSIIEYCTK
nr:hypothetical protein [uncultured Emticicia sp.]